MLTKLMLILAGVLMCQPASASGGLDCSAEGDVTIEISGGVTHGMGGPLFSFEGRLEIAGGGIAADLGSMSFARNDVVQYWLDGKELRLLLYRERVGDQPFGYVELTIRTMVRGEDDEGNYVGRYELNAFDMTEANGGEGTTVVRDGDIACSVE